VEGTELCLGSSCSGAGDGPVPPAGGHLLPYIPPSALPPPPCVGRGGGEKECLPLQPSERGSLGPGESGTPEGPVHPVVFETPEAISLDTLEDCSDAIFETPVVGSEGAPPLSCYFTFGAPTSGSEFSPAPWVAEPSRAERGPDPAPAPGDSGCNKYPQ